MMVIDLTRRRSGDLARAKKQTCLNKHKNKGGIENG